tara:strand:+ start:117 stop:341 length:225 start_codon:yes stop_codon:yes gene_type:complete
MKATTQEKRLIIIQQINDICNSITSDDYSTNASIDLKETIMIQAFYNHTPIKALKSLKTYAKNEAKKINEEERK